VLNVKLRHLEDWHAARREKALRYNRLFEEAEIRLNNQVRRASEINEAVDANPDKLLTPVETTGKPETDGRHVYHQYVIRTKRRDELQKALDDARIGNAIYYPVPLHKQECFAYLGYQDIDCPNAAAAGRQTLALPIYPELTDDQQEYIVAHIVKALT
jgi:dTDP-4-amino-4,6-dideoxygalactose transaminase